MEKRLFRLIKSILLTILPFSIHFFSCQKPELQWHQENGYRWAELSFDRSGSPGFTKMPPEKTGIVKINRLTKEQITTNRHLLNGSGVAIGDIDGDGLADVYLCQMDGANALYKNLGNWQFRDITKEAGVACENQFSTGAVFADIDADNDLDLIVTAIGGPNACFLNDGAGTFSDFTRESGIQSETGAMSLALADTDGDGDLDLYIVNNKKHTVKDLYPAALRTIDRTVRKVGDSYEVLPEFKQHYQIELQNGMMMHRLEVAEPDMYFLNDGTGRFSKVSWTDRHFLDEQGNPTPEFKDWGLSVRFQDMDNDGDPDLYICNDFESPDRFWLNDGTGNFQAIDKLALRSVSASSMGVDFSDINRDGHVDFFITEMLSRRHDRRKRQQGPVTPAPTTIGKYDDRPQYMRNSLFLNRGDNTFVEIGQYAGIDASEWSWSPLFLDVDLDGYEDLLIVTGHYYDGMDMDTRAKLSSVLSRQTKRTESEIFRYPRLETQNFVFRNRGDLKFDDVSHGWGFDAVDVSHGMATGDLDNDGDPDVVYNSLESPPGVYRNDAVSNRIAVRLLGQSHNTQAIGAKIRLIGGLAPQSKEVICGGTYLSASDQFYTFAANGEIDDFVIEVQWRNGKITRIEKAKANRVYEMTEPASDGHIGVDHSQTNEKPFFEEVSELISHSHHEAFYNDFKRQPMLTKKLSQLGPAVAWLDVDGNMFDDLLLTSGRGGRPILFRNKSGKSFIPEVKLKLETPAIPQLRGGSSRSGHTSGAHEAGAHEAGTLASSATSSPGSEALHTPVNGGGWNRIASADQISTVGWRSTGNSYSFLISQSNYEAETEKSIILQVMLKDGRVVSSEKIIECEAAIGPMALADYDSDGDLDLFVGGRAVPGRYPEPASSYFYRNENGYFERDAENTRLVERFGLVSGAVFSDIDVDGDADLILAVDWGPISIFRNHNGVFDNATEALGMGKLTGWWNGVATGDLNADGKPDIIATNWGLNTKFRATLEYPFKLYYGDFDNNGTVDLIEAYYDTTMQKEVPETSLALLGPSMPFILSRVKSFEHFSTMSLQEILGSRFRQVKELSANTLASMVFINGGERFVPQQLPPQAQFTPAFYAGVADYDGDGNEDIFLSQNFFSTNSETARNDGGRGLWLKGDGAGSLQSVPGHSTGVLVYGEQRGAALGDFDNDGRIDLAVSQNGAKTKLFRNIRAAKGLRIRLIGPQGNPDAIGASVRLVYDGRYGPVREIQAGSGYAAQNSATLVFGISEPPTGVWVKWPNGKQTLSTMEKSADEIIVDYHEGKIVNFKHFQ